MAKIIGGCVSLIVSLIFLSGAVKLSLGALDSPGSGLFPFIVSIMAGIFSLFMIMDGIKKKDFKVDLNSLKKMVGPMIGLLLFFIFLVSWNYVGYFAACAVMMMLWLIGIGKERLGLSIVTTILVTVVFYATFVIGLEVPLPI